MNTIQQLQIQQQQQIQDNQIERRNSKSNTLKQALAAIEEDDIETIRENLLKSSSEVLKAGELLVSALELNRTNIAEELIDQNICLNCNNDDESNCLMIAAKKNNLKCLQKILDKQQIDIDLVDLFGWTALMYSCYYGHSEITRSLLMAGAQPDIYDNDNMNSLIWAAGRGHVECVNKLIQIGRAKVDQVDKFGTSPLIWACRKGHTEVANTLLKAGANINSTGMFGWSALLVSVLGDHIETLKLLLQHKPNVNTCDAQRHTPLIAASKEGKVEIVRLLLKARAFVNLSDEYGHTALIHAAKGAHLEVVDLLLKNHADIDHTGVDKKTALFWAVEKGNLDIVERLLQNKPNIDHQTVRDGETCLMKAVKLRKPAIVRVLLAHQAKVSLTDKNGDTVLHMAVRMQSATLAQLILSNPKNHFLLQKPNKSKRTPLMLDMDNSLPVFPSILVTHNQGNKVNYKLSDANFSLSQFHLDTPQSNLLSLSDNQQYLHQPNPTSSSTSSSSLIKKLTNVITHNKPPKSQTQTRVLA